MPASTLVIAQVDISFIINYKENIYIIKYDF